MKNQVDVAKVSTTPNSTTSGWLQPFAFRLLVITLLAEIGLRLSGAIDFPIYSTDADIGYVPRPGQVGSFLNKNRWVINDRSMNIADKFEPCGQHDLLLTGDSVVWGGNYYDQPEKLGSQLQNFLPSERVWPISAGSWSVENVRIWCKRNPDVVRETDTLVWVLNDADFSSASKWKTDATHPRSHPWSAIGYSLRKYAWPRVQHLCELGNASPDSNASSPAHTINLQSRQIFEEQLGEFIAQHTQCIVVLYPSRDQTSGEKHAMQNYRAFRESLSGAIAHRAHLVEVLNDESWSVEWYRDGMHPTAQGCRILAEIIRDHLERIFSDAKAVSRIN